MAQSRSFFERFRHGWNVFRNKEEDIFSLDKITTYSSRPDRTRLSPTNEQSIISSVYSKLALDACSAKIIHARVDKDKNFLGEMDSYLNEALTVEANLDQTGTALILDIFMSMLDEGCIAVVPVDTSTDPDTGAFEIYSLRVGQILEWGPGYIRVRIYNEQTGKKEDIVVQKTLAAIIENPLYSIMNEPNSTLKRLILKLNLLDAIDKQSGSGKLDIIIQLPYVIKTPMRKAQAELRRTEMENQLADSKYGIAYADGTEKITQLNRPAENNLMKQIEYLTSMLFSQLGLTKSVFDGTADEATMLNYYNRTIDPLLKAVTEEMHRKFLSKTARTQGQKIMYQRDLFKLSPVSGIAEIADKFTRNEILTSNEIRGILGRKPSKDPEADKLSNKNLPVSDKEPQKVENKIEEKGEEDDKKDI